MKSMNVAYISYLRKRYLDSMISKYFERKAQESIKSSHPLTFRYLASENRTWDNGNRYAKLLFSFSAEMSYLQYSVGKYELHE